MRRVFIGLCLVTTAACGGGSGDPAVVDGVAELKAVALEFEFRPDAFLVPGEADEILVTLRNAGSVEHNLALLETPIDREEDLDPNRIVFQLRAAAGDEVEGLVDAPGPGTYQVICTIEGHFTAGMVAELRIRN